mmetsp:Transcript_7103/g.8168  ORF Transcript_7103/g.8168 Transcript_7103/m.8168 type:complete len:625 (+) Transcript_7103:174-2048(+)
MATFMDRMTNAPQAVTGSVFKRFTLAKSRINRVKSDIILTRQKSVALFVGKVDDSQQPKFPNRIRLDRYGFIIAEGSDIDSDDDYYDEEDDEDESSVEAEAQYARHANNNNNIPTRKEVGNGGGSKEGLEAYETPARSNGDGSVSFVNINNTELVQEVSGIASVLSENTVSVSGRSAMSASVRSGNTAADNIDNKSARDRKIAKKKRHKQELSTGGKSRRGARLNKKELARRSSIETIRKGKWVNMSKTWDKMHKQARKKVKNGREYEKAAKNKKKLQRRVRKGIPNSIRGMMWVKLADLDKKIEKNKGKYDALVQECAKSPRGISFSENRETSKSRGTHKDTIERDINRTFPRHCMFTDLTDRHVILAEIDRLEVNKVQKDLNEWTPNSIWSSSLQGSREEQDSDYENYQQLSMTDDVLLNSTGGQGRLRRVLRAYSIYDNEVGYCQGMNFIAATFITFVPEEEAFWLLVTTMNEAPCQMRLLFDESMSASHRILYVAEKLIQQFFPLLFKHLEKETIHISMFATQWLLTLYTSSFPFDLVARVWDCFITEGWKIVYRVMLALLELSRAQLMQLKFEEILGHFRTLPSNVDGKKVMDTAITFLLKTKHIEKYEKQWNEENNER